MPVIQTLIASRNATWGPTLNYDYQGQALPLAGATIAMQLRRYPGQPNEPKLNVPQIPFTDNLVSGTPATANELRRLTLEPLVGPDVLAALPGLQTPEAGGPQRFAFDIRITYADGLSEILAAGDFMLFPGVTV